MHVPSKMRERRIDSKLVMYYIIGANSFVPNRILNIEDITYLISNKMTNLSA
jgi:hypothetical protein